MSLSREFHRGSSRHAYRLSDTFDVRPLSFLHGSDFSRLALGNTQYAASRHAHRCNWAIFMCSLRLAVSVSSVQAMYNNCAQLLKTQTKKEMSRVTSPIRGISLDAHRGHHCAERTTHTRFALLVCRWNRHLDSIPWSSGQNTLFSCRTPKNHGARFIIHVQLRQTSFGMISSAIFPAN